MWSFPLGKNNSAKIGLLNTLAYFLDINYFLGDGIK